MSMEVYWNFKFYLPFTALFFLKNWLKMNIFSLDPFRIKELEIYKNEKNNIP